MTTSICVHDVEGVRFDDIHTLPSGSHVRTITIRAKGIDTILDMFSDDMSTLAFSDAECKAIAESKAEAQADAIADLADGEYNE